jgi:acyl-coenzyme A thioesterase PaaI-like protein
MAGPTDVVFGGILAAVVDCHCVCTAIADAYRAAGHAVGEGPGRWAVTASLRLDYLAPTPIGEPMELRARVREARGRKRVVECVVRSGGRETVRAEVIAVYVPDSWGRGGSAPAA